MGRFMSPDWSAKEEPVPYARLGDPQTLNLYAYLVNNPLAGVDADGHCGGYNPQTGRMYCPSDNPYWFKNPIVGTAPTLPKNPQGLPDGWKDITPHPKGLSPERQAKIPRRFQGPKGSEIEFDPANPNASPETWEGTDHWHEIDPATGKREDGHLEPGDPIPGPDGKPDPEPQSAAEPEASKSAMDKVNDWLNDHLPQSVKDYLREHPYGPNSSPAGAGPGPAVSPIWAEPW
jgi:hypothetical protein